jgi:hypothetical protein
MTRCYLSLLYSFDNYFVIVLRAPSRTRGRVCSLQYNHHREHTDTVLTSQETYYVSATKTNRLMLPGETVAVYCENNTESADTVRTSQETHYVSATEPNLLMLFRETVAVYC